MNDKELYAQILGLASPWLVEKVSLSLENNTINVSLSFDTSHEFLCPECGKASPRHDKRARRWRHLDTCQLETIIECDVPRINCETHGVKLVDVPWAGPRSRLTLLFEAIVIKWLEVAPISSVAERLNLDWDTVLRIQKQAVERGLARRGSLAPKNISIDETSEKKGHNYLTIVSENEKVLYVETGRDRAAIDPFWKKLSEPDLEAIESVSVDLWKAFRYSTLEHVPDAMSKLCLDRFHVAGYFTKAVNDVRKKENRELSAMGDDTLKGTKFDWLRTSAKIDNRTRKTFMELTKCALKTSKAWMFKEIAHSLWNYIYIESAIKGWSLLLNRMARSRLKPMVQLAASLKEHLWMVINSIRLDKNSANAESNNSRIQKVKKMACGFRNSDNFKTAIYFHLGGLDMRTTL